jgi:serine/threonine protein kinase/formylglycine-generating enzyme required for sulfatase activity
MTEESLFLAALEKPPAERQAFLEEACGQDIVLRARVQLLLEADARARGILERAPSPPPLSPEYRGEGATVDSAPGAVGGQAPFSVPEDDSLIPKKVPDPFPPLPGTEDYGDPTARVGAILAGKYKLIEEIGEGGMGSVFMAQQTEPVKRAVAVKVIKAGMDSKAVLARFEAERQALAMMDHPNIAKVLDAGTTDGGRPFFVMELVKGTPITRYCDERRLTPRQRLELFVPVCQAIQHAHQKGIIHRDIKPSNVLVAMYDDRPVPKVIDFGVAKAAGQSLTEQTLMTGFGQIVGTPEYMSPEQASLNNLDIDTRSDVYSLGVLLYELLTGTTPVDKKSLGKAAVLEILRIVREVEAPRPSAKLSTIDALPSVAANRGTEPAKLSRLLKRELDWLVMKALEKDRTRRYDTANALARDIQRYLADEVVEARPPSMGYRVRKFVRRHRAWSVGSAVAVLLLIGATITGFVIRGQVIEQQKEIHAKGMVPRLLSANTADVPTIVKDMESYRRWIDPLLYDALKDAEASKDARKQLHASLALLPSDPGQLDYLRSRLLTAGPDEVVAILNVLAPHKETVAESLWAVLEDVKADPGQRLRAACALAAYAPDDDRWRKVSGDVARQLVAENAFTIGQWAAALKPVARHLLPPLTLLLVEEGRSAESRRTITAVYAACAKGVPSAFLPLEAVLAEGSAPKATPEARLALARRHVNAAVALAALGRWEQVWPLLRHTPDPTRRSYLIDRLGPGGVEARAVIDRLSPEREPDVSARRALLLALGEFDTDRLRPAEREVLVPRLLAIYQDDPDPGTHGAVAWLLRQWGQQVKVQGVDRELATGKVEGQRQWYVNGQRQTFVIVPHGELEREPVSDEEGNKRVTVRVARRFALAAREVTVAEFLTFRKDHQYFKGYAPTEDCPVISSWYDAAAYCNWLNGKEGIPEEQRCYLPNEKGEYAAGMKVKANGVDLSGYRLPTDAEWEFACRSGSLTQWSLGEAEDLLVKYGWYRANSSSRLHPVGLLRPNDLGLFDLPGNAWEWCQTGFVQDRGLKDHQLEETVKNKPSRVMRGGAFDMDSSFLRSAWHVWGAPEAAGFGKGFRPARTFIPPG